MSLVRSVLQRFTRSFRTTSVKQSDHGGPEGFPGANVPFSIENRYKLTAMFILFFGSGFSTPFLLLRSHLKRQ